MTLQATDIKGRIERALEQALSRSAVEPAPARLAAAMRHAVFPGGARVRARLCLAAARACGDDAPDLTDAALSAVELLHCASLVHDDMPCFDDSPLRRGRLSVHAAFGEPVALLAGDALIVLAFETLAVGAARAPARLPLLLRMIAGAVGMPNGIVAGQGYELEPSVALEDYHRAKTGALFVGSAMAGAVAAGANPEPWRRIGEKLGEAYQVADDLRDALSDAADIGKPVGQDAAHHRPNAVSALGCDETLARLSVLIREAIAAVPDCPGASELEALIRAEAKRLVPKDIAVSVA